MSPDPNACIGNGMAMFRKIDPLIRLLFIATLFASIVPVRGIGRDVALVVANAAVFMLFLLYGMRLARKDVLAGISNLRFLLPLTLWCFGAMALIGWALWRGTAGWLDPPIALGFVFLGCLPSTVQSATAYSSLAGGNVAASVVAAAWLNILGVIIAAPLFALFTNGATGGFHGAALGKIVLLLLLPFVLGQALQNRTQGWVTNNRSLIGLMDRITIAIAVYVALSGAVVEGIWHRVSLADWAILGSVASLYLLIGYGGAWLLGGIIALPRDQRITMLFAGAQKSVAMGAPLATVLFPPHLAGMVMLPLLLYHLAQLLVAAPIAARLRGHLA